MPFLRSHPRTLDTNDLSARVRATGCHDAARRVLDLSEGGMLVTGERLEVGAIARFELAGPDFRFVGLAKVAHSTSEAAGLRFVHWDASADRQIRGLIAARLPSDRVASAVGAVPGGYLG
jgi:hypothetical protein